MDITGLTTTMRLPAFPLTGMACDKIILIHMAGYEDWSPRSPDGTVSRTSSEHGSSTLTVIPFDWTPRVLDGRSAPARHASPDGCRTPPKQRAPRDNDFHEPPCHGDVPKSTRFRQLFPSFTSERSVRIRTWSPPAYHRAWNGDHAMLDQGRPSSYSPRRSARGSEALQHASEDWERRRLRSPVAKTRPVSRDSLLDFFTRPNDDWGTGQPPSPSRMTQCFTSLAAT
jgi:hypothetical protein